MELGSALTIVSRIIDVSFAVDMLINFRTAYYDSNTDLLVTVPSRVALRYLQTSFATDFLSTFPFDLVVSSLTTGSNSAKIRSLKLIRTIVREPAVMLDHFSHFCFGIAFDSPSQIDSTDEAHSVHEVHQPGFHSEPVTVKTFFSFVANFVCGSHYGLLLVLHFNPL